MSREAESKGGSPGGAIDFGKWLMEKREGDPGEGTGETEVVCRTRGCLRNGDGCSDCKEETRWAELASKVNVKWKLGRGSSGRETKRRRARAPGQARQAGQELWIAGE